VEEKESRFSPRSSSLLVLWPACGTQKDILGVGILGGGILVGILVDGVLGRILGVC